MNRHFDVRVRVFRGIMRPPPVLNLLFLCCIARVHGKDECYEGGQALDCSFQHNNNGYNSFSVCNWTHDDGFKIDLLPNSTDDWWVQLNFLKTKGRLSSKNICSTREDAFCLKFQYDFEKNESSLVNLSVSIIKEGHGGRDMMLWTLSSDEKENDAQVPIQTCSDFVVVFTVKRLDDDTNHNGLYSVAIDNIQYVQSPCETIPSEALPDTLVTKSTTTVLPSQASTRPSPDTTDSTDATRAYTDTTDTMPDQSVSNIAVIVDPVVAILSVIMVIAVTLIVVKRRRNSKSCQSCIKGKEQNDGVRMNSSHNAAFSLDDEAETGGNHSDRNVGKSLERSGIYHVPDAAEGSISRELNDAYNSLDFDRKNCVALRSEGNTMGVYNRLDGGDDNTYNEVNRDQRVEVIDGEYSHIK
ncbi:uncharacterized protein [Littorina saxatilis]|uniref:uncharacterized protein n=1 Tax=Littorina saxatilis TaxID=31220 RepID=UPI0038B52AEA